jgi:hypothetical protein
MTERKGLAMTERKGLAMTGREEPAMKKRKVFCNQNNFLLQKPTSFSKVSILKIRCYYKLYTSTVVFFII